VNKLSKATVLLADRGYYSDAFQNKLKLRGITPCIPPRKNLEIQHKYDKNLYKQRHYDLSDAQWSVLEPLLPGKKGDVDHTASDNRLFINAVLWVARNGANWRSLPAEFGKWNIVFVRYNRWCQKGVWERIFNAISDDPDFDYIIMIDSSVVKVHQHAAGVKRGFIIQHQSGDHAVA
jgi:transposase